MAQRGESVGSPDIHQPAALPPLLARRLFLARAALFWEGFWPGLLPAAMVAAVFLILAGFDVWRFTPVWLHWAALAGFTAAFGAALRSEEHTSELQSLMRISYAVFCLKKKTNQMVLRSIGRAPVLRPLTNET